MTKIQGKQTKIKILEAECEGTTAQITGMPHGQGNGNSQMESAICKKLDLEREIESINAEREALRAWLKSFKDAASSGALAMAENGAILKQMVESIVVYESHMEIALRCGVSIKQEYVR